MLLVFFKMVNLWIPLSKIASASWPKLRFTSVWRTMKIIAVKLMSWWLGRCPRQIHDISVRSRCPWWYRLFSRPIRSSNNSTSRCTTTRYIWWSGSWVRKLKEKILITCNRDDFIGLARNKPHYGIIVLIRRKTRVAERAALIHLLDSAGENGLVKNINFA